MLDLAPYSDDTKAIEERERCDYTVKINIEMAKNGQSPRPVRVYADGFFDLFHIGHANVLKQAKLLFPNVYMIAGVHSDKTKNSFKGKNLNKEWERYEIIRHSRFVDEVLRDAPWIITKEFLDANKIDFVAHDADSYTGENNTYKEVQDLGKFIATQRTEGISTTDLLERILDDNKIIVSNGLNHCTLE